jgi:glycosyltransferase involved in cell wall biosynthesis
MKRKADAIQPEPPGPPGIEAWRIPVHVALRRRLLNAIARPSLGIGRGRAPAQSAATTAVIVDPALVMEGGHNYSALLRLKAELSKLSVEHACLASITADASVRELAAAALPTKGLWWRSSYTRTEFLEHARAMREELSLALNDQKRPPDLLILPCCDAVQIDAVAGYYGRSTRIPSPHLLIWLLFTPHHFKAMDDPSAVAQIDEYKQAFAALRQAVGDDRKITVACETTAMAAVYSNIIGLDVEVAPGPNLAGASGKKAREDSAPTFTITTLGHANSVKGYHLLPEAIARVLGRDSRAAFFIHGTFENADSGDGPTIFGALSELGSRVVTSNEVLPPSEYRSRLHEADILLLPYDRATYETRGSGLFNEAREIGIPVVATRGCAFAQPAFDEGWGVEIAERSSVGLADAILAALQRLPELTAQAEETARRYQVDDVGTILPKIVKAIGPEARSARATAVRQQRRERLLPATFLTSVSLGEGASVRDEELPTGSVPAPMIGKLVETTSVPFVHSVVLSANLPQIRALPIGSRISAEISIQVVAGRIGVVWADENAQVVDDTERYAPAMANVQRLVVSASVDRASFLVFRNFTAPPVVSSFRILELKIRKWIPD